MAERRVVVESPVGLHARPAAAFTRAAKAAAIDVTIKRPGGDPVSAASILSVLTLNVACGDEVVIEASGEGADQVLDDLSRLLQEHA